MSSTCQTCRESFDNIPQNEKYAEKINLAHPDCICQNFSVSDYSSGPVLDNEKLYRMIVLPGDLDEEELLPFEAIKSAYKNGMSVFRGDATNEEIISLAEDRLYVPKGQDHRSIFGFIELDAAEVRQITHGTVGRVYCIYDQTVPRKFDKSLPHVGSHVGIFQKYPVPEPGSKKNIVENKKEKVEKAAELLFDYMKAQEKWIDVSKFRYGFLDPINEASKQGAYEYTPTPRVGANS